MAEIPGDSVMLLTPRAGAGGAAIAVVRVRGAGVGKFLGDHFSKVTQANRCVHGELRDAERVIDDPVVVVSADGLWADFCLHGGSWVVESAIALAQREGFEFVNDGAESALDEAGDMLEREMLAHLPAARTEAAIRLLLAQPECWRKSRGKIDPDDVTLWRLLNPPVVAIIGEPNVGKSTLANFLFGQQRSITADVPGTTRDWVGEMADINGLAATLVDTPGIRDSEDGIERAAIEASAQKISGSDLAIEVLDATREPVRRIDHAGAIVVVNKIDQRAAWDFGAIEAICISAKAGNGIDALCGEIHRRLGVRRTGELRACWWTERQRLESGQPT
jgi:small GTP-binding protein